MHMMMGGAGVVVVIMLIIGALVGWAVLLQYTPMLVGSVFVGMLVGLGAAIASAWRERRENQPSASSTAPSKADLRRCPNCGKLVDPESVLCPNCHLDLKRNCPQCGAIVDAQASCCPSCGERLEARARS